MFWKNCIGRYFSGAIRDKYGCETGKINSGFVICEVDEDIEPYVPGEDLFVPLLPQTKHIDLVEKTLFETYDMGIITEIFKENSKFIFQDETSNFCYVVIDGYKVFVSNSVAYLTEEQLIRTFDTLTFYSGAFEDGASWFRLGLPKKLKISQRINFGDT